MASIPDEQIHPVATGKAAQLVAQHQRLLQSNSFLDGSVLLFDEYGLL